MNLKQQMKKYFHLILLKKLLLNILILIKMIYLAINVQMKLHFQDKLPCFYVEMLQICLILR